MDTTYIKENEVAEDLQFESLYIILNKRMPSFTTDAVLLSDFAKVKETDRVADFGTGTGIIALLMYGRYKTHITGFEIQPLLCDMANRSFLLNGLETQLHAECMDFTQAYKSYNGYFTAVVCNPPYFDSSAGAYSDDEMRAGSRTQLKTNVNSILCAANKVLKSNGRFFMCYPASALVDAIYALRNNKLEPKRIRFVKSSPNKPPYLVLIEARKDGGKNISFDSDLIITDSDGFETDEIKRIYHRNTF